ncbi:MAG: hypothetical protein CM15mP83_5490 [Flavobacteriaceae bacterium]|nr:MAG: hypothetical protein CM15mP83_5490 [Flavobacteriaceae bacterium]
MNNYIVFNFSIVNICHIPIWCLQISLVANLTSTFSIKGVILKTNWYNSPYLFVILRYRTMRTGVESNLCQQTPAPRPR